MTHLNVDKKQRGFVGRSHLLGFYSHIEDEEFYEETDKYLRVLRLPSDQCKVCYDLTEGYVPMADGGKILCSRVNKWPGIKKFLQWINDWCFGVTKFRGTIYFYEFPSEQRLKEDASRDEHSNKMTYGGFRFEEYITEPIGNTSSHNEGEDGKREFVVVAKTKVGGYNLVFYAEMDSVRNKRAAKKPSMTDFVEIKTTRSVDKFRRNFHRYKLLKWWAQSYLGGTQEVVFGYRDDDLVVREITSLTTVEMEKAGENFWTPGPCTGFLKRFLDFVKETVKEDDPHVMYEFTCKNNSVTWIKSVPTADRFVIPNEYITAF